MELQRSIGEGLLELANNIPLPYHPHDIAVDTEGHLYILELDQSRVHKIDADGNELAAWGEAGAGEGQFAFSPPPDAPPLDGGFVVVDEEGTVYVSDSYNNRVQVFNADGNFKGVWSGLGGKASFNNPGPISADWSGRIYVGDFSGVHEFTLAGEFVRTLELGGEVAKTGNGDLFSSIAFNSTVLKINPDGEALLTWGEQGMEAGQFNLPIWIVTDRLDRVYVSDHTGRIQVFDSGGAYLGMWNDPGNDDPPLVGPAAIAGDGAGTLYVAPKDRSVVYILKTQ